MIWRVILLWWLGAIAILACSDTQSWDVAGRRTQFNVGNTANYGFAWRSDYTMAAFLSPAGSGLYGFDTAGLLTNRTATVRSTTITARDGEGHPLNLTTTVNGSTVLTESLSWLGDGLLASHTLADANFNDYRTYAYAPLSRRLTQEQLNLNATTTWTNNFAYDGGTPQGPGVLTSAGQTNAQWSGTTDAFSRLTQANNTTVTYSAQGHVAGWGNVSLWLDNRPVAVTAVGTNNTQWNATMELSPGPHQLVGSAVEQPTSQFTSWATNYFTNSIPYQTTSDTLDLAGNTTQRVWLNANGTTNRIETLSWDARGRLHAITERDATNSGYNWTAVYDPLNRRLSTTSILVTNGVAFTAFPNTINQYYDPQADCLELGVAYGTKMIWKLYGPDLDGVYGGLNGRGGFDGYTTALGLFLPTICDFRGNVLGYVTNSSAVIWNPARPTAYGAVPGYRPVALGNGANVPQSSAWGGLWPDITGYYNFHQRVYDPITGHWLSGDPSWNEHDPNWYTYCGGDPVNRADPEGMLATTVSGYAETGVGYGLASADALWNLGVATFLTPTPENATPQQQAGLTQIALDSLGSPLERMGLYDSSPGSSVFTQDLPAALGQPMQNLLIGYGAQPGVSPVDVDVPAADYSSPQTSFYVTPDGTAVPATGYRAIGGSAVAEAQGGVIEPRNPTYITFDDLTGMSQSGVQNLLQLPRTPTSVATFDTLQIVNRNLSPFQIHNGEPEADHKQSQLYQYKGSILLHFPA
jgi:RHS repeat-associated protein